MLSSVCLVATLCECVYWAGIHWNDENCPCMRTQNSYSHTERPHQKVQPITHLCCTSSSISRQQVTYSDLTPMNEPLWGEKSYLFILFFCFFEHLFSGCSKSNYLNLYQLQAGRPAPRGTALGQSGANQSNAWPHTFFAHSHCQLFGGYAITRAEGKIQTFIESCVTTCGVYAYSARSVWVCCVCLRVCVCVCVASQWSMSQADWDFMGSKVNRSREKWTCDPGLSGGVWTHGPALTPPSLTLLTSSSHVPLFVFVAVWNVSDIN